MENHKSALILLWLIALAAGCDQPVRDNPDPAPADETVAVSIAIWHREKGRAAIENTSRLIDETNSFLDGVSSDRSEWQAAWLTAHDKWLVASMLRKPDDKTLRGIDAWPIEPGFLDSLPDYPETGIVNDATLTLNSDAIREQHQYTSDIEVALGFHVIEYYAFSRDTADMLSNQPNSDRRRHLIRLAAGLLMIDLLTFASSPAILPDSHAELLSLLHLRSQAIFSEFNRLGEHSQSSAASLRNITVQLVAIETLLKEPVSLNDYLIELDPAKTETLNASLKEAIVLTRDTGGGIDQSSMSRALLLVSALSHQLEDLIAIGKGRVRVP